MFASPRRFTLGRTPRRGAAGIALGALALAAIFGLRGVVFAQEAPRAIPAPALDEPATANRETAVLAGGCFWGVQGVFQHVKGVTNAVSGYAGGERSTAEYETVSGGRTGHAESVKITFDPRQITYGQILQIYFSVAHDPTEWNRQGPDTGTQYRSAIFPETPAQAKVAEAYIAQLGQAHAFGQPMATKIETGKAFYPAERYHQNYLTLHPDQMYIAVNDLPKVEALKRLYPETYRAEPVLVAGE